MLDVYTHITLTCIDSIEPSDQATSLNRRKLTRVSSGVAGTCFAFAKRSPSNHSISFVLRLYDTIRQLAPTTNHCPMLSFKSLLLE